MPLGPVYVRLAVQRNQRNGPIRRGNGIDQIAADGRNIANLDGTDIFDGVMKNRIVKLNNG